MAFGSSPAWSMWVSSAESTFPFRESLWAGILQVISETFRVAERMNETDLNSSIPCPPWSNRVSKMAQPNLDFMGELCCLSLSLSFSNVCSAAPETQSSSKCSLLSDMFSLGMVICAVYNNGRPLIQAGNSTSNYAKQLETVSECSPSCSSSSSCCCCYTWLN